MSKAARSDKATPIMSRRAVQGQGPVSAASSNSAATSNSHIQAPPQNRAKARPMIARACRLAA